MSSEQPQDNAATAADAVKKPLARHRAGFDATQAWVFDLDNTLYPAECNLFAQVDQRMGEFIASFLGVPFEYARHLQKSYYRQFGTTLSGLMKVHKMRPEAFLDYVHDIDLAAVPEHPELAEAIKLLPGRRLIFTNGTRAHAERVAGKLGILDQFEDIFDIVHAGFLPKPERATYENFLAKHSVDPGRAAMFEDIEKNLIVPSDLGMKTVLIIPQTPDPFREAWEQSAIDAGHVHHVTADLTGFLRPLGRSGEQ